MNEYINKYYTIIPLENESNNNYKLDCFNILNNNLYLDEYYSIINHCNIKTLNNILNFININWSRSKIHINNKFKDNKYKNKYINNICKSHEEFNNNVRYFIGDSHALCIYIINMVINYISINF